jgi:hypothetical protein
MGITTAEIIEMVCYKINYAIRRMNNNIYVLRPIQRNNAPDIMVFFDEETGLITSNTTLYNIQELFNESVNECYDREN